MKKLLFLLSFTMVCFGAMAQPNLKNLTSDNLVHKLGIDTVSGTGSIAQSLQIGGYQRQITFQAGITKLTGTPAGIVKLLGSVDNVKFDYVNGVPDSLIVTNVSGLQVKTWFVSPSRYQYYKVVYKGSGTATSTINTVAMWRQ